MSRDMDWKIGCSGYHYPDWKGVFYPSDLSHKNWFEFYCTHFNTLELNATYYKFPRVDMLRSWHARSPGGFTFTVKAPRHITHYKKFKAAQRMIEDFNETVKEGLGEKLGCVLFQFPSNFQFEAGRLDRIIDLLDTSLKNVLEFRHESWWDQGVFDTMAKANIGFCGMSHPTLPQRVISTSDIIYYRFHGVPHLYNSKYDLDVLEQVAHEINGHSNSTQAYIYFNNTADGHAVVNARQLQNICELVH